MRKNAILTLFALLCLFSTQAAKAEYRVYQYVVKSKLKAVHAEKGYVVTSTLDPVSYVAYHGGDTSIKVDLLRTWMCKGYTGAGQPLCESPAERAKREMEEGSVE